MPRKIFGRITVIPKRRVGARMILRMVLEFQVLRYVIVLLPFILLALVWTSLALPFSQAPALMFLVIWFVEMRLLRRSKAKRAGLLPEAEVERGLDLLNVRAKAILTKIAAMRGRQDGAMHLVIEQSELARVAPLTMVSLQDPAIPAVLNLSAEEEALLQRDLFQPPLTEHQLHLINQAQNLHLRDIAFDPRQVSAHARLTAMMG